MIVRYQYPHTEDEQENNTTDDTYHNRQQQQAERIEATHLYSFNQEKKAISFFFLVFFVKNVLFVRQSIRSAVSPSSS